MALNTNNTQLQALSRNNANASSGYNSLMGILEGAEGSIVLREKIYKYLETLITGTGSRQIKQSLKDTNSLRSAITLTVNFLGDIIGSTEQERNNHVINKIKENVLDKEDLSENAIIRFSALNRFEVELTPEQNIKLLNIEKDLSKIVEDNIPDMKNTINFSQETNTQKIQKVSEMINFLAKKGLLETYPEGFDEIKGLLSPLRDLNKKYHELNQARNTFYDIQRGHSEVEVLNNTEGKKLEIALNTLTGKNLQTYFETDIKPNLATVDLNHLLELIKISNPDIQEKIITLNLNVGDFEKYFLFYFSSQILKRTKIEFEMKKLEIFKDKRRDFEADVKTWREIQRDRLVELCQTGTLDEIENIFNKDRKLFLRTGDNTKDITLRNGLLGVLSRRYPTTPINIIEALADAIMNENEATNRLYYGHENDLLSERNNDGLQSFLKATGNAGRNIQKVGEYTTPIIGFFVKFGQKAVEKISSGISSIITTTTGTTKKVIGNYNEWANKKSETFLGGVMKFPFKASQILTRPLGWGVGALDFTANKGSELISGSYNSINEVIKSSSNDKIDSLFDIFTKTYKYALKLGGVGTAWSGDKAFDILKTSQKREILSEFYNSRNIGEVRSLLESIDMQSKIKDSSPYIFDHDGFDDLGYEVKEKSEGEIKTFGEKLKVILKGLGKKQTKDPEIYGSIIDDFNLIKDEIENSNLEEKKFKYIKRRIKQIIQKLSTKAKSIKTEVDKKTIERGNKEDQITLLTNSVATASKGTTFKFDSLQTESSKLSDKIDELNKRLEVLIELGINENGGVIPETFIELLQNFSNNGIKDDGSLEGSYDDLLNNISL